MQCPKTGFLDFTKIWLVFFWVPLQLSAGMGWQNQDIPKQK